MRALVTTISFLAIVSGYSQTISVDKLIPKKPFIEVVGIATKEVNPDKIFVSIVLSEKNNDNGQNSIQNLEVSLK